MRMSPEEQVARRAARKKAARQRARELGLCSTCFIREPAPGRKSCTTCATYARAYAKTTCVKKDEKITDALLDRSAFVHDVDVVFSEVSNVFAVKIGSTAVIVRAGQVTDIVPVKRFERGPGRSSFAMLLER